MDNLEKVKIVLLGKLPPPYIGPAVATEILLKSKIADRYHLFHLDTSDHRDINTLGAFDLKNIVLPFWQYGKLMFKIIRNRPQAVYIPSAQTTVAFLRDVPFILTAKFFRRKVICHLRGGNFKNWYNSIRKLTRWLVRHVQKMVDAQIVLGDCLVDMYADMMPREKIFVVPNGGDFPIAKRIEDKNNNAKKVRILFLANFIKTKGVLEVLHAAPEVLSDFPDVEFIFAGSWRDKETQSIFIEFLSDHPELPITVMPPISGSEKFKLLASADFFVFPTYYSNEGHPWCILEAMASGLPVISTDQGAIRETVIDGGNGFLIEKENAGAVAEKIKALLADPKLREKMGRESRRIYEENFTEAKMVERMSIAFDSVLKVK
jgi:glycosyltransferase involved in cell wall biosynthesis